MIIRILIFIYMFTLVLFASSDNCKLPEAFLSYSQNVSQKSFSQYSDIQRNTTYFNALCIHKISFKEEKYNWKMLLVYNKTNKKGPFWFLPHDDEESAFDAAVYAAYNYGGGFLSVLSNGERKYSGQDPNRNFGINLQTTKVCTQQAYPAPLFSKFVFNIINTYKTPDLPYLALHNNSNGWYGNGGQGTISILKSSTSVQSYPSGEISTDTPPHLNDEDNLIYIAGTQSLPPPKKLKKLIDSGIHVKYEVVNKNNNDCSMSNFVVLNKDGDYYNIESQHGDTKSQKIMIDKLMHILNIKPNTSSDNLIDTLSELF